jgi:ribonuclease J
MRACIHRGTKEIGGTCVEVEAQGRRIVLDVGQPLDVADPDDVPLHPVPGFDRLDPSLLGVIISHPHLDHYGLAGRLPKGTPFFIGKAAAQVLRAARAFVSAGAKFEQVHLLADRTPIALPPFTVTPYLVDHSAYDAYAILVEAEGATLFYSGDLRAHGRKGALFHKLLRHPPEKVDVLLLEGTTVSRPDKSYPTEAALERRFVELFRQTPGMPLVWCSGQNIDRLVTIFKACRAAKRELILDMYTAHVLESTGNQNLPHAGWEGIRVFLPNSQKRQIIQKREFDLAESFKPWRVYPEELKSIAARSVMLFRPSMIRDLETSECLHSACVICSLWSGYLQDESTRPLLSWIAKYCLPLHHCHTSGHASVRDLLRLRGAFPQAPVVPIHTEQPERFAELFGNAQERADGEWWEIQPLHKTKVRV